MRNSERAGHAGMHHRGGEPHLLREIVRTHQTLMAGFSRHVGIPASQFALLRMLATAERQVGVLELARELGIDPAAVTRQVQEASTQGLVLRRKDAQDGRRNYVTLSARGLRVFRAIHERSHKFEHALASVIGADEMALAARVLAKLRAHIENINDSRASL